MPRILDKFLIKEGNRTVANPLAPGSVTRVRTSGTGNDTTTSGNRTNPGGQMTNRLGSVGSSGRSFYRSIINLSKSGNKSVRTGAGGYSRKTVSSITNTHGKPGGWGWAHGRARGGSSSSSSSSGGGGRQRSSGGGGGNGPQRDIVPGTRLLGRTSIGQAFNQVGNALHHPLQTSLAHMGFSEAPDSAKRIWASVLDEKTR